MTKSVTLSQRVAYTNAWDGTVDVLEQDGTFGSLPALEQQRLIQDLSSEYVRR